MFLVLKKTLEELVFHEKTIAFRFVG